MSASITYPSRHRGGMAGFNNKILIQSNSWDEFRSALAHIDNKSKGDSFETLAFYYLKLHPEYATKLKDVWLLKDVPRDIRKKLNLPIQDEGIDLLALTNDDEYWAVQCKYREDENHSLTRKELSTFTDLAFGICRGISLALVCTTADRFSHKLELYENKISFCAGDKWRELSNEFFLQIHRCLSGKAFLPTPLQPKTHQKLAISNAEKHFIHEKNTRGKMIMPCGTGKSLAAYWIAEKLKSNSILVAVPSLSLIQQTLGVWTRESYANKKEIRWICVCSDETVREFEKDDMAVLVQDLGVHVHTDTEEIADWLRNNSKGKIVVITTYQSGKTISAASKKAKIIFDLGIFDEAHKTAGKKDSLFSHLIYDDNIEIKRRIFMTATERRYLGSSEAIASMEDPDTYGDTFNLLSFKTAVEQTPPILSDYKIVTINVKRSEIARLVEDNLYVRPDKGRWDKDVEAGMLAGAIALRKAMIKYPIKHAVSFHSSISRAIAFKGTQDVLTDTFNNEYGQLDTFHVSGSTPTAVRKKEIDCFEKSEKSLITNARCLTEGVDVPNIDCVLFADPRGSAVDIVQAVGRALRPYQGKEFGYVIVPILVDEEKDLDINLEGTAFETLISVLKALASNDERIIEYFRAISRGKRPNGKSIPVDIDIPLGVKIDADQFIESIELKCWSRLAKLSWRLFEDARRFVHTLKLASQGEWFQYGKGQLNGKSPKPEDIPTCPHLIYKDKGWIGFGDWLGTGTIAPRLREYRLFKDARKFAQGLKLTSSTEWHQYSKGKLPGKPQRPDDIPSNPDKTYKDEGWIGFGDWLGTGSVSDNLREYRPFKDARRFVQELNLESSDEWYQYSKGKLPSKTPKPDDIPTCPYKTYKDKGWKGMGDWLGTGTIAPRLREYRPFKDARKFAHGLKLASSTEWYQYCKGKLPGKPPKPDDIPVHPHKTYKDNGWIGMGDWLGTGTIAPRLREYRLFKDARKFAQGLNFSSGKEWQQYCKGKLTNKPLKPDDIPASPRSTYKDKGWIGMGNWLGTGNVSNALREYRNFNDARKFAQGLNFSSGKEWYQYCKGKLTNKPLKPDDIPADPNGTYKGKGWIGMGDWLGTGSVSDALREYRPFKDARKFAQGLNFSSGKEWHQYCKGKLPGKPPKPDDISASPHKTYKDNGWIGMGDWLGTGNVSNALREYRPFKDARKFAQGLKLTSSTEWRQYSKGKLPGKPPKPDDISASPNKTYKDNGWISWGNWLGTGTIAPRLREYRLFKDARNFAQGLKLASSTEWHQYSKGKLPGKPPKPDDIPICPHYIYKDKGWIGFSDWLGTGTIAPRLREYRSFKDARKFAQGLKLTSSTEWHQYCKGKLPEKLPKPDDIPAYPNRTYKGKGWIGMGDWLGTGNVSNALREYRPFKDARKFAHGLKLTSSTEWRQYSKGKLPGKPQRPDDIPSNPDKTYKDEGWIGFGDWLGTGTIALRLREYRPFKDARKFAQGLNFSSGKEWHQYCKGKLPGKPPKPDDISASPDKTYKDNGWIGMGDWLGIKK